MLKKAKKRIQKKGNPGGATFKFQFVIHVKSVEFMIADKSWQPAKLIVEWKRNARVAATQGGTLSQIKGGFVASFADEELSMLGTLSRDEDEFDPKEYKFSFDDVRDRKSKKALAGASVDLAPYASLTGAVSECTIPLEIQSTKISSAKLVMSITSRLISQGNKEDDDMSMMSTASFAPEDNRALNSSDSEASDSEKKREPIPRTIDSIISDKRDEQINELLKKIQSLETELANAYSSKKDHQDLEKEVAQLRTKMKIDAEKTEITMGSLVREKHEAEERIRSLRSQLDSSEAKYSEQIRVLREELAEAQEEASRKAPAHPQEDAEGAAEAAWKKKQAQWQDENRALEKQVQDLRSAQQEAEQRHSQELLGMKQGLQGLQGSETLKSQQIAKLEEELASLRESQAGELAAARQEGSRAAAIQGDLEAERQQRQRERDQHEAELRAKEEEWARREKKLQAKIDSLEESAGSTETSDSSAPLIQQLEQRIAELEEELEVQTQASDVKIRELQNLVSNLKLRSQDEEDKVSRDLGILKVENETLKEEISALQSQLQTARGVADHASSGDSENSEEARRQLQHAQTELAEVRKKYDRLLGMYEGQEKIIESLREGEGRPEARRSLDQNAEESIQNLRSQNLKLTEELNEITSQLINAKLGLAEGQFMFEKMKQAKKDAAKQLAAEKLKSLELRKKLTQFEVKSATNSK